MSQQRSICVLTGIFPPDTGGPAKFASTFPEFCEKFSVPCKVLTYTSVKRQSREYFRNSRALYVSRSLPLLPRYITFIFFLLQQVLMKSRLVANGCFIELGILRRIVPFAYVLKLPGDIVWERARNSGKTNLDIEEFQNSKLPFPYYVMRRLFSYVVSHANHVIVPSKQLQDLAILWGAKNERISLIHNSVDIKIFSPRDSQNYEYDYITVGRLVKWKNIDQIIQAVGNQNKKLLIVGEGPEKKKLQRYSSNFQDNICFVSSVMPFEIPAMLAKAPFFILNSNFEATSYALLEAMAMGLVPISTESTGSAEVITHMKNGILCGSASNLNLEQAIILTTSQGFPYNKLSSAARMSVINDFNLDINYSKILEILFKNT